MTELACVPDESPHTALGSVTLKADDPAAPAAACRETTAFYRDRAEPGNRARRKNPSNGTSKEKTVLRIGQGGFGGFKAAITSTVCSGISGQCQS